MFFKETEHKSVLYCWQNMICLFVCICYSLFACKDAVVEFPCDVDMCVPEPSGVEQVCVLRCFSLLTLCLNKHVECVELSGERTAVVFIKEGLDH